MLFLNISGTLSFSIIKAQFQGLACVLLTCCTLV